MELEEEHEGFDYTIDLDTQTVLFRDGFSVPIIEMFDEFGETTLDPAECATVFFRLPGGDAKGITFYLKEFLDDLEAGVFDEPEH